MASANTTCINKMHYWIVVDTALLILDTTKPWCSVFVLLACPFWLVMKMTDKVTVQGQQWSSPFCCCHAMIRMNENTSWLTSRNLQSWTGFADIPSTWSIWNTNYAFDLSWCVHLVIFKSTFSSLYLFTLFALLLPTECIFLTFLTCISIILMSK